MKVKMSASTNDFDVLLFKPKHNQVSGLKALKHIPRYLFRLHAPDTAGRTTITDVTSPAWCNDQSHRASDLFELQQLEAASRLREHFWWTPEHQEHCNLMSWSSSLLFVLQHGFRRRGDSSKPTFADIQILVVDTSKFPRGTFASELHLLSEFAPIDPSTKRSLRDLKNYRNSGKYFGEYITQGRLDITGRCSQTSLEKLDDLGLKSLCPWLYDHVHPG